MRRLLFPLLLLAVACDDETASEAPVESPWLADVEAQAPRWLGDTGLFADLATLTPAEGVLAYRPPYPLWSSGAEKDRLLYLPPDTRIDTSDPAEWDFPVGTVLAKTFTFDDVEGQGGAVPVETRLIWRRSDGWRYAQYLWNAEGTEALAFRGDWSETLLELLDPEDRPFDYTLPGKVQCEACHETHAGAPIIGVAPRNFAAVLVEAGALSPAPEATPPEGRTAEEGAVMEYALGNCVHCHHGEDRGENAAFSLRPEDLVANTVDQETASSASGIGVRVVPGDPEGSALYQAVVEARAPDYAGDFKPMPPVGVDRSDPRAAQVLRAWIDGLGERP